jgi:hypothetical protein
MLHAINDDDDVGGAYDAAVDNAAADDIAR